MYVKQVCQYIFGTCLAYVAEIDVCKPNPCLHGGACEPKDDGHACACKDGFTGVNCETS